MANIVENPDIGWLRKSIDSANAFAERNREWADTIAENWKRTEGEPSVSSAATRRVETKE